MNLNLKIIGLLIPIVLIGSFAAPIIMSYATGEDNQVQYDDYFKTTATSATGSLELITSDGVTYAHAKDLGDGSLSFGDGHTENYNVKKAELIILYLTGQSNSAYNEDYAQIDVANEELTPIKNGMAYYYGTDSLPIQGTDIHNTNPSGPWDFSEYDMYSMTNMDGSYKIGHIEAALASVICSETTSKLFVINGGQNGRSIIAWEGSGNGMTLDLAILSNALESVDQTHYNVHIGGYIWLQGEADYNKSESWYIEKFTNVNSAFNSNGLIPCYIIQVNKTAWPNPANAQETIAATFDNVFMGSTASQTFTVENGMLWPDTTAHYTQKGYDVVGTETAHVFLLHNPNLTNNPEELIQPFLPILVLMMVVALVAFSVRYMISNRD